MKNSVVILIPAYNPTEILEELVQGLKANEYRKIIVVNDGSINEDIFKNIEKNVILLKHDVNLGKGKALKTGLEYCINNIPDLLGVITVDADGQHLIKDINKVYEKLIKNPKKLILGSRDFDKENVPFRSDLGNKTIRYIFKLRTKLDIKDTQTGLRGIPVMYLKEFGNIIGDRFEYETNMLMYAVKQNIQIEEEEIESIYINKNEKSNFRVIKDSVKIVTRMLKEYKT